MLTRQATRIKEKEYHELIMGMITQATTEIKEHNKKLKQINLEKIQVHEEAKPKDEIQTFKTLTIEQIKSSLKEEFSVSIILEAAVEHFLEIENHLPKSLLSDIDFSILEKQPKTFKELNQLMQEFSESISNKTNGLNFIAAIYDNEGELVLTMSNEEDLNKKTNVVNGAFKESIKKTKNEKVSDATGYNILTNLKKDKMVAVPILGSIEDALKFCYIIKTKHECATLQNKKTLRSELFKEKKYAERIKNFNEVLDIKASQIFNKQSPSNKKPALQTQSQEKDNTETKIDGLISLKTAEKLKDEADKIKTNLDAIISQARLEETKFDLLLNQCYEPIYKKLSQIKQTLNERALNKKCVKK